MPEKKPQCNPSNTLFAHICVIIIYRLTPIGSPMRFLSHFNSKLTNAVRFRVKRRRFVALMQSRWHVLPAQSTARGHRCGLPQRAVGVTLIKRRFLCCSAFNLRDNLFTELMRSRV